MLRGIVAGFSFVLVLLLTACGGDSQSSSVTTPASAGGGSSVLASVAVKGLIENGEVRLLRWQDGAYTELARSYTASDGRFSFPDFTPESGEVLKLSLRTSTDAEHVSRMVCDAAQCGAATFGEWVAMAPDFELTSWASVAADGSVTVMPMTPVSTLLVGYAESLGGGHLKASALSAARQHVAAVFRLSADELMATPGNVASSVWMGAASESQRKMSLLAAAFAELAGGDAAQMQSVVADYTQAFIDNNGRLMEQDPATGQSLAHIFGAINTTVSLLTLPAVQETALAWSQGVLEVLRDGQLSAVCQGDACNNPLDSGRFVTALGAMGEDMTAVMQANGYSSLEQMVSGELGKFGWLVSNDTVAVAGVAVQTLAYSFEAMLSRLTYEFLADALGVSLASLDGSPVTLTAVNGLSASLAAGTLTVSGQQNGLDVNLQVSLPALLAGLSGNKQFSFAIKGSVSNERIRGDVDATLLIDAGATDFEPLLEQIVVAKSALSALQDKDPANDAAATAALADFKVVVADLLRTASFSVAVEANKFRLVQGDSMLAVEGSGSADIAMDGGLLNSHRIVVDGHVDSGRITLPNGSWLGVGEGESLVFAMNRDGTLDADFSARILTLFTGEAHGVLGNMGVTLSNLRDGIADQLASGSMSLNTILSQLLTDVSGLSLTLSADMRLVERDHLYKIRLANGDLSVSQPDSDDTALAVSFSLKGLLVSAGQAWWLFAPDFKDATRPAILISDDTGGAWRLDFDLGSLLAGL